MPIWWFICFVCRWKLFRHFWPIIIKFGLGLNSCMLLNLGYWPYKLDVIQVSIVRSAKRLPRVRPRMPPPLTWGLFSSLKGFPDLTQGLFYRTWDLLSSPGALLHLTQGLLLSQRNYFPRLISHSPHPRFPSLARGKKVQSQNCDHFEQDLVLGRTSLKNLNVVTF